MKGTVAGWLAETMAAMAAATVETEAAVALAAVSQEAGALLVAMRARLLVSELVPARRETERQHMGDRLQQDRQVV